MPTGLPILRIKIHPEGHHNKRKESKNALKLKKHPVLNKASKPNRPLLRILNKILHRIRSVILSKRQPVQLFTKDESAIGRGLQDHFLSDFVGLGIFA
jgi:hypothetical protein